MPVLTNPTEIARETLKLLASRRILPTPENYRKIYGEIAGVDSDSPDQGGEQALRKALQGVARINPALARNLAPLEKSLAERDWKGLETILGSLLQGRREAGEANWSGLIHDLIRQWEIKRSGLTPSRKREALERVLVNFANDPAVLHEKLAALVGRWASGAVDGGVEAGEEITVAAPPTDAVTQLPTPVVNLSKPLELLAQTLENGVVARAEQFPDLLAEVARLAGLARSARELPQLEKLEKGLKQLWFELELRGKDEAEIVAGLLKLLRLLVDNISELVLDDQWLHGQVEVVREVISHPLDARVLYDAERGLKEVIYKQGNLKHSLNEAKTTLKNMIATFVDRLGEMSESTSGYHDKIEHYSVQLSKTEDITQMNAILSDILRDTRGVQLDIQRSRDELVAARRQVEATEKKVRELEAELEQVSEKVHEDQLTGALNRHGLEEAFQRELPHAERTGQPLCLALLDLDNFKRLNDTYGHQAGDAALVHLTKVIKDIVRPTDTVARYGGEEFIVILPETPLEEGVHAIVRLQRELTKRFFLHNNERLLITFSAGVALRAPEELPNAMIARADAALYKAKAAGKNRVLAAD